MDSGFKLKMDSQLNDWKLNQKFPLMFIEKNGKDRVWACWVKGNVVYRTDGLVGGKLKEPQSREFEANTISTAEEKAIAEAEKMWLKQFDNGYAPKNTDSYGMQIYNHVKVQKEQNGGMNRGVKLFGDTKICSDTTSGKKDLGTQHRPMLAKKYKDFKGEDFVLSTQGEAIKFPAILQAKVDGIRALPTLLNGKIHLESRNGNDFVFLNHIREELKGFLLKYPGIILDGELYVHKLYKTKDGTPTIESRGNTEMTAVERYQFISESCKITRKQAHPYEHFVEFWVFDIWDLSKTNVERLNLLQKMFKGYSGNVIKMVPTETIHSHDDIEKHMIRLIGENTRRLGYEFEGVMIRQSDAKYVSSTTHQSCLLKYKRFSDDEWEICGAEICKGTHEGAIKWLCQKMVDGDMKQLVAKQMGDVESSKRLYNDYKKNPTKYNGKMLNIRYNELTKDDVPRFPRATSIVEDK